MPITHINEPITHITVDSEELYDSMCIYACMFLPSTRCRQEQVNENKIYSRKHATPKKFVLQEKMRES